jgi:mRNA interferase MazF
MSKIYPKQYEIWFADLGPSVGREPGKIRPVVIMQSDLLNKAGHRTIITCPISSQFQAGVSIMRIAVEQTPDNGLLKTSYILCDQLRVMDVSRLKNRTGILDENDINRLIISIKAILSL